MAGDREDRHRGGNRDRHLDQEDRLPGDQLGEQAADCWSQRRPGRPGGRPEGRGSALGADRGRQQLQHRGHRQGAAERLHATSRDQSAELVRDGAGETGAGEDREPDRGGAAGADTTREERRRHRGKRHHQVEGDEDPADAGDTGVELAVNIRQGEDDDRGVGQDQPDGERQRRDAGTGGLSAQ